jgi:predicted enzyme related to lactoylglutathione lyase
MSEQTTQTASAIVWFELPAADSERARNFYGQLFGWQFQPFGEQDYHTSYEAGGAIDGARGGRGMLAYFDVAAIDEARNRVVELGGGAGEVQQIPGVGLYVHCTDTEGNSFGLYHAGGTE